MGPDCDSSILINGAKNPLFDQLIAERAGEAFAHHPVPQYQTHDLAGTKLILRGLNTNFETWSCFGWGRSVSIANWGSVDRKLPAIQTPTQTPHPHESE